MRTLCRQVVSNATDFRTTMADTQKELFKRYLESMLEYQTLSELLLFQNSCKHGTRLMVEIAERDTERASRSDDRWV